MAVLLSLDDAKARAKSALAKQSHGPQWKDLARPEQLRPVGCDAFILQGGRGSGKTRAAAEDILELIRTEGPVVVHVLCPTRIDAKKTCIKGDAGSSIIECARPGEVVGFNQTELEVRFANGSVLKGFSAEEPGRLNGPQCHILWIDEYGLCSTEAIDMAILGHRLGRVAKFTGSSTPKPRPGTKHVLSIFPKAHISRMRLQDNRENLAPNFIETVERRYAGTRLGRAEIDGEMIEDVEGALWEAAWFDAEGFRLPPAIFKKDGQIVFECPKGVIKTVVALDPSVTDPAKKKNPHKDPDACGVIVAGLTEDARGIVLGRFTAIMSPAQWAKLAVKLYSLTRASGIIAEANQGGELIREVIRSYGPNVPVNLVHASMAKRPRAEPVAMLYEQGRVQHCGEMSEMEDQMTTWDATDPSQPSPNDIDALVWAFHGLGLCEATGTRTTTMMRKA